MRLTFTIVGLVACVVSLAAPQRGENLLANPAFEELAGAAISSWRPVGEGYQIMRGDAHSGDISLLCKAGQTEATFGAMQEITFDPPIQHPFRVTGWSKSEAASGNDYCLYMDCWYDDGTNLWGQRGEFSSGTHGWEKVEYDFHPTKPISKIEYFILFRRCTGTAWFDDVAISLVPFELVREKARAGVYGGNSIDYLARLSLPARWTASIEREGAEVFEASGSGPAIDFSWAGTDPRGKLLPGGAYTVRLEATDDLLDGRLVHARTVETAGGQGRGYAAWTETSMERVLRQAMPPVDPAELASSVALARNEYESFQIAIRAAPGRDLEDCTVAITDLRSVDGDVIPAGSIDWHQVGFVHLAKLHEHPSLPDAAPGWWPDPLLPVSRFSVPGGVTQSLWFTVYAPADAVAGDYAGAVTVRPGNADAFTVPLTVTVYDFAMPDQPHIKTAFALMDGFLERIYGPLTPELRQAYGDYLLNHRLNPDDISRTSPPALEDLEHYRDRGLNAYNVINMVKPRGESTWVCWSPLSVYTPEFKQYLTDTLDPHVAELKERGLADRAYVYTFDERGEEFFPIMKEYFGLIKDRYGIPTLTTAKVPQDPAVMRDLNVDWNCPVSSHYRFEEAEQCRAEGLQVWSYICLGPRYPFANWLADDPLVEARVIWWQAFHQKMDGFLYWGLNIWGRKDNNYIVDPDADGPQLKWSISTHQPGQGQWDGLHGDGVLLYPAKDGPIGCIRLANIRDGIEDYEYLYLLAALEGDMEAGREACLPVTTSLTAFTRNANEVCRQRENIARRIEKLLAR